MFYPSLFELLAGSLLFLSQVHTGSAADVGAPKTAPDKFSDWTGWGGNVYNNRWSTSADINSTNLGDLKQNCKLDYPVGVSATPVVLNNTVFYPTSNGSFYALNYGTCEYVWSINVTKICYDEEPLTGYVLVNSLPISRTSPQIDTDRGILYFGTQAHALLVAVNLTNGDVLGTIRVSDHPLAILTMSPTLYDGNIYIGASSQEESATLDPTYPCCDFIGVFASYSFDTKKKKFTERWHVNTLPEKSGWSGATVWGSQPAIDPKRGQVFIGTGNTYIYPVAYEHCVNETASCLPDDVWQESVVALDMKSGKVNWRKTLSPLDGWVMVCGYAGAPNSSSPLCPGRPGPDADFGMAPTFVPAALGDGTTGSDTVVIGQKSGNMYSFNAATGKSQWSIVTSPDSGTIGGPGAMSWGMATDDQKIYFTAINYGAVNWTLQPGNGPTINNSAWGAANLKTGALEWEVPVPELQLAYTPPGVVNDVMFVGRSGLKAVKNDDKSNQSPGAVIALAKSNGNVLYTWPVESVQRGGVLVSGGFIMFGSGYHYQNSFADGSFYVYGLPDAIEAAKVEPTVTTENPDPSTGGEPTTTSVAPAAMTSKKSGAVRSMISSVVYPVLGLTICMIWFG
jgi:outer membrane protein assembly factor BamB